MPEIRAICSLALPLLVLGILQMTITTPWRRMILQRSQRVLTDAETFTEFLVTYLSR